MPKYYCDYCDIYLTHDSPSVRKSHNEGWKHKAIVKAYYSLFERDETQILIEQKIREHETQARQSKSS
jgi:U1 small nuclear ribonucleoprotein C